MLQDPELRTGSFWHSGFGHIGAGRSVQKHDSFYLSGFSILLLSCLSFLSVYSFQRRPIYILREIRKTAFICLINQFHQKKQSRTKKYRSVLPSVRSICGIRFLIGSFLFLSEETDRCLNDQFVKQHKHRRKNKDHNDHTDQRTSGKQRTD